MNPTLRSFLNTLAFTGMALGGLLAMVSLLEGLPPALFSAGFAAMGLGLVLFISVLFTDDQGATHE